MTKELVTRECMHGNHVMCSVPEHCECECHMEKTEPEESTKDFVTDLHTLLEKYPDMSVFVMLTNDRDSAIVGNTCPMCAFESLAMLAISGKIKHFDSEPDPKASLN